MSTDFSDTPGYAADGPVIAVVGAPARWAA